MVRRCAVGVLVAGLIASDLGAQVRTADPIKRGLQLSAFPRLVKLAPDVYGYEEIRNPGFTTVSLIVIGRDGALVADGQGSVEATTRLLQAIGTLTTRPVKWYVVGSDHGDHTAGNAALPKDITFVAHPASRAQMERDAKNPNRQPGAAPVVVPPAAMTSDRQTIDLGGIEVQVLFLGRAHTGGDLHVYVPRDRILFMSEAYLNRVFPAMRSAYPTEWVGVIDRALGMDVAQYIPGHGFIEEPRASREELVEYQNALKAVIAEVTRLHKSGLTAEVAAKQARWGVYADWFLVDQQGPIAVRKVYDEIEGRLPK